MCCIYTRTQSLNLFLFLPVSLVYSSLQERQMMTYIRFELSRDILLLSTNVSPIFLNVWLSFRRRWLQHSHLLLPHLNTPISLLENSALVRIFLRFLPWRFALIIFRSLLKPLTLLLISVFNTALISGNKFGLLGL